MTHGMKTKSLVVALTGLLLVLGTATPQAASAADAAKEARPKIYDESADGTKLVNDALAAAKKEKKHALLQFGANWCGWCHKLHKLMDTDKDVAAALKAGYIVVMVDVDKGHNKDLTTRYQGDKLGLPFIVVLDSDGKRLITKDSGELEEGDHHNPQKVLSFLKDWAPKS